MSEESTMDDKTKAENLFRAAAHLDSAGETTAAANYRATARELLHPPQPEWQDGDFVLDRHDMLWKRRDDRWHSADGEWLRNDDLMVKERGPLRRVYLADPAKGEVVVSVVGLAWDKDGERTIADCVAKAAQAAGLLDEVA